MYFGGNLMLTTENRKSSIFFIAGVLSALAVFLLTGAATLNPVGKYDVEAVVRDRTTQIYVIDTTTGAVKWVDTMNTSFAELKGD